MDAVLQGRFEIAICEVPSRTCLDFVYQVAVFVKGKGAPSIKMGASTSSNFDVRVEAAAEAAKAFGDLRVGRNSWGPVD